MVGIKEIFKKRTESRYSGKNNVLQQEYRRTVDYANKLFVDCEFKDASHLYSKAIDLVERLDRPECEKFLIVVMLVTSLVDSDDVCNLQQAFNTLQSVCDSESFNIFPVTYYLTAKVFYRLYRFNEALEVADEGLRYVQKDKKVSDYNIPTFRIPFKGMDRLQLMNLLCELLTLCHKAPTPNGICNFEKCQYKGQFLDITTRNIYIDDPFFEGMISFECSNKNSSSIVQFHKSCWIEKKKSLLLSDVPDKDFIDMACFSHCEVINSSCVISRIKIHDQNSTPIIHVSNKKRNQLYTGAIKKQILPPEEIRDEMNNHAKIEVDKLVGLVKNCGKSRPYNKDTYNDDDIFMVLDNLTDPQFTGVSSKEANEKKFIYSMFKDFISGNLSTTVGETRSFWKNCKDDFTYLKDDIIHFLLNTNTFIIIDGQLCNKKDMQKIDFSQEDALIDDVIKEFSRSLNDKAADDSSDIGKEERKNHLTKNYPHTKTFHQAEVDAIAKDMKHLILKIPNEQNIRSNEWVVGSRNGSIENTNSKTVSVVEKTITLNESANVNTIIKDYADDLENGLNFEDCELASLKEEITNLKDQNQESMKDSSSSSIDDITKLNELSKHCKRLKKDNLYLRLKEKEMAIEIEHLKKKLTINEEVKQIKDEITNTIQQEYNRLLEEKCKENEAKYFEKIKTLQISCDSKILFLLKRCLRDYYSMNKKYLASLLQHCNTTLDIIEETNVWTTRFFVGIRKLPKWGFWRTTLQSKKSELENDYQRLEKLLNEPLPKKFDDTTELLMKPINLPLCEVENVQSIFAQIFQSILYNTVNMQSKLQSYYMSINSYNQHYLQNLHHQSPVNNVQTFENECNDKND